MIPDSTDERRGRTTRRRFVRSAGVVAGAAFAGRTGATADVQAAVDPEFTSALGITDPNVNFNEFNFTNYSWELGEVLYDPLAQWDPTDREWRPFLLDDWSVGEEVLALSVADDYTWHTGDPLTAEDVAKSIQLEIWMGFSPSEYATAASAAGDGTVELDLAEAFNPNVIEHELLGGTWVSKPPHVYGEWYDRFQSASGSDEMDQVRAELSEWTLPEPFGYGPFAVESMNEQRIRMVPHDGHPAADAINFDAYVVEFVSTNQKFWQALRTDRIDAIPSVFAPDPVVSSFPDHVMQVLLPDYGGFALTFDHEHPDFGRRPVRQAVAHVVDRAQVANNVAGAVGRPVELVTGLPAQANEKWLSDVADRFEAYETDADRAASLLSEAGYERRRGTWTGPDGPLSATLHAPAGYSDWVTACQTMAGQLEQFGMDVQFRTTETGTFWSEVYDKSQFVLTGDGFGGGPYPLFAFQGSLNEQNRDPYNYPAEVTVPAFSGSGDVTVNLPSVLAETNRSAEGDAGTFRRLAWLWNQDLPKLPVFQHQTQSFITTDDWEVPPADDPVMKQGKPAHWLPKVGELRAETG